jgi:hypothetical protein
MKRPEITINGNHQYVVEGVNLSPKTGKPLGLPSCSTISKHIGSTSADPLIYWGARLALDTGKVDAFKDAGKASMDIGTAVHAEIEHFIKNTTMPKDPSALFLKWFAHFRELGVVDWIVSEYVLYHPKHEYGGTIDAMATMKGEVTVFDWKTTTELSSKGKKNDPRPEHAAQLGGYFDALLAQPSAWWEEVIGEGVKRPTKAYVVYLYKDTENIEMKEVDLWQSIKAFRDCHSLYQLKGDLYV